MSVFNSDFDITNDYLYLITPIIGVLILVCFVYVYCSRCYRYRRQPNNQNFFQQTYSRLRSRGDDVCELSSSSNSQRGAAEGDVRFNLEYQHFYSTTTSPLPYTEVNHLYITTLYI